MAQWLFILLIQNKHNEIFTLKKTTGLPKTSSCTKALHDIGKRGKVGKKQKSKPTSRQKAMEILHPLGCIKQN
jgi:hypothetical protein